MKVRFWGVRGSIAVSGPNFHAGGGNTSCVEVEHEGQRLVFDGGTGLRDLGESLASGPQDIAILFSHYHWDHIQGVPFFRPAYDRESRITFAGGRLRGHGVREVLERQMRPPNFPITLDAIVAETRFEEIRPGHELVLGPFRIRATELSHPDGVLAFRVEAGGRSVVYATDNEHGLERIDPRLVELAAGADLLIHDAQYLKEEYLGEVGPERRGWGHSTWDEAVSAALLCGVGRLALYHHDPNRDDQSLVELERAAKDRFPGAFVAREGGVVELEPALSAQTAD